MEAPGVRQGMSIMHSDVMDTVFHNGDIYGIVCHKIECQNELNIVLC